jgi:hypothetical protein
MTLTNALIPRWTPEANASGPDSSDRPVLIGLDRLGAMLRGQILSISSTHAEIMPDEICHLFRKVDANIRFHIGDTAFSLTGLAVSCEPRRTIVLQFDKATRVNMSMLRKLGMGPAAAASTTAENLPAQVASGSIKRTKQEQRTVLHLPPPGGIERRIEPRFNLDVRATLYLRESDEVIPCSLLEVSRSGCRLFSDIPFGLQSNTHVEVAFHGNGEFHRLGALIRPKLDEHLTGLSFVDLNSRHQGRLNDLVGELQENKGLGNSYLSV